MEQWIKYKKWCEEHHKKASDSRVLKEYLALDYQSSVGLPFHEQNLLGVLEKRKGEWVSVGLIQTLLPYFARTSQNEHNCVGRNRIRQAIRSLRLNESVDWVIISGPRGYKIPTQAEALDFAESLKASALKKLKLYWTTQKKLNKHNQLQFKDDGIIQEVIAVLGGNYEN